MEDCKQKQATLPDPHKSYRRPAVLFVEAKIAIDCHKAFSEWSSGSIQVTPWHYSLKCSPAEHDKKLKTRLSPITSPRSFWYNTQTGQTGYFGMRELLAAWIHDNHVDTVPSLERSPLIWIKIFKANLSRVDGVQSKRLKKIQMGCRCCKMIQSYIFDPEEAQSPGCIHEVNSYKHNEQGSDNPKFQENSEIQEHKSELQKDELNRTENQNQVNSTNETLWNNGGNDFPEDGLLKCVAKPNPAVNGGNSCAGAHSVLNANTNPGKEASEWGTSIQSEASSASNRDFYNKSNRSAQELDAETSRQVKAACNEPNSVQEKDLGSAENNVFLTGSAILETRNNVIQLPDVDYPQNENQTRNYVEKDSFSVSCGHSHQNSGPLAIQDQDLSVTPPSPVKKNSIESFQTDLTSLSEGITAGTTAVAGSKAAQIPTHSNPKVFNGETEEEDAEVAAALAALEAATAGEDLEDDDEY